MRVVLSQHALQVVSQHVLQQVSRGDACSRGCLLPGGLLRMVCSGGSLVETSRDGYCCGRYASYWNVFLLSGVFLMFVDSTNVSFDWMRDNQWVRRMHSSRMRTACSLTVSHSNRTPRMQTSGCRPFPHEQNDWQTGVKHYLAPSFVCRR